MQTKSPQVRIIGLVALAISAFFLSAKIQGRTRPSLSVATKQITAAAKPATILTSTGKDDWARGYGKLPLAFEANRGQTAPDVQFLAHGQGYQLFLTRQAAVLTLRQSPAAGTKAPMGAPWPAARQNPSAAVKTSVLRIHFDEGNPATEIVGTKLLPGKVSYFIGNDPQKWHTEIPSYETVRYQGIYPGVDVLFYGRERRLEYDFIVAPERTLKPSG